jgi:hypothetical protein
MRKTVNISMKKETTWDVLMTMKRLYDIDVSKMAVLCIQEKWQEMYDKNPEDMQRELAKTRELEKTRREIMK